MIDWADILSRAILAVRLFAAIMGILLAFAVYFLTMGRIVDWAGQRWGLVGAVIAFFIIVVATFSIFVATRVTPIDEEGD